MTISTKLHGKDLKNHMEKVHRSQYVRNSLLSAMGADNGCQFIPCAQHSIELAQRVFECQRQGLRFTKHRIEVIAYGEEEERKELLKAYASGPELSRVLGRIFDGCRRCHTELPLRFQAPADR